MARLLELPAYKIHIGSDGWEDLKTLIDKLDPSRLVVVCDAHTRIYCLPILQEHLGLEESNVITVPAGELHKNLETCRRIWQRMMRMQLDRGAVVLNLGGGVIGDMGGFCASLFKRGLRFIQLPTTLLAQVDASIGGKLGIDFMEVKNSIGLFRDPEGVFIFPEFLSTLPGRELRSGFAEMIKHALIGDSGQWERMLSGPKLEEVPWLEWIPDSIEVKKRIVLEDPLEQGVRKLLNFGHTIGHAVESQALKGEMPLLHGEAIAVGMVCEAYLSHRFSNLSLEDLQAISGFIRRIYGHHPLAEDDIPRLIELMRQDKKNVDGKISFSLLQSPGRAIYDQFCPEDALSESIDFYNNLSLSLFEG